jgi:hypothetical protein
MLLCRRRRIWFRGRVWQRGRGFVYIAVRIEVSINCGMKIEKRG